MKHSERKQFRHSAGFTLIEILMVLALLALVFSVVGSRVMGGFGRGKVNVAKIGIRKLEESLDLYKLDCNVYPTGGAGLKALVSDTGGCSNYNPEGYLKEKALLKDPWDNEWVYSCDDGNKYEIKSLGSDRQPGGEGDAKDISSNDG